MRVLLSLLLGVVVCTSACGEKRNARARSRGTAPIKAAVPVRPVEITQGMGVRLSGQPSNGTIAITLANAGNASVHLARGLRVDRFEDGEWDEVDDIDELTLRPSCGQQAPECIHLVPGAELYPPAWLGTVGHAQCECSQCAHVDDGTYRFVALSCEGDREYRGSSFVIAR